MIEMVIFDELKTKTMHFVNATEMCLHLQKMDKNRDGVVTLDEFILSCQEVFLCGVTVWIIILLNFLFM